MSEILKLAGPDLCTFENTPAVCTFFISLIGFLKIIAAGSDGEARRGRNTCNRSSKADSIVEQGKQEVLPHNVNGRYESNLALPLRSNDDLQSPLLKNPY